MMSKSTDPVGRIVGILVFLVGICLLGLVFWQTYTMLTNPVPELTSIIHRTAMPLKSNQTAPPSALPAATAAVVAFLLKLALLLIAVIAGSIISSKGIHLYFTAAGSAHPSPTIAPEPPAAASAAAPPKPSQ